MPVMATIALERAEKPVARGGLAEEVSFRGLDTTIARITMKMMV